MEKWSYFPGLGRPKLESSLLEVAQNEKKYILTQFVGNFDKHKLWNWKEWCVKEGNIAVDENFQKYVF